MLSQTNLWEREGRLQLDDKQATYLYCVRRTEYVQWPDAPGRELARA